MIEINEVKPVVPSLTIVISGYDITRFKAVVDLEKDTYPVLKDIWMETS